MSVLTNLSTKCVLTCLSTIPKACQQVLTMLLFYQVATRLSLVNKLLNQLQDDNKLLEQLVTSLLGEQACSKLSTNWEQAVLLTSC